VTLPSARHGGDTAAMTLPSARHGGDTPAVTLPGARHGDDTAAVTLPGARQGGDTAAVTLPGARQGGDTAAVTPSAQSHVVSRTWLVGVYRAANAPFPAYTAPCPSSNAMRRSWLYLATRSDLERLPVLI
jgi:hypothetical protein